MSKRHNAATRSHTLDRGLVRSVTKRSFASVPLIDAIVVPTIRPATTLGFATSLARKTGAQLIVICSGSSNSWEVHKMVGTDGSPPVIVQLPSGYDHPMFDFSSSHDSEAAIGARADTGLKRNIGLTLGRAMRWQRMFFLDDDVRGISTGDLELASEILMNAGAAGFFVDDFPDHSVLGHALRLAGAGQQTFLGGGSLMVDPSHRAPFFPSIYNEDSLFLHDWTRERMVASAGNARQLPYQPFADPGRAHREEFGDVLVEGLHQLIHQGRDLSSTQTEFWADQLIERRERIIWATEMMQQSVADSFLREQVITALNVARNRLRQIEPPSLGFFIDAWRTDVRVWAERYRAIPHLDSVDAALDYLGLTSKIDLPEPTHSEPQLFSNTEVQ